MTKNERRLAIVLVRFQNAVEDAQARSAEAADQDAGFDGGEFSGPAHRREYERECDRIAQRFGFATADVAFKAMHAQHVYCSVPMHVFYGFAAPLPE